MRHIWSLLCSRSVTDKVSNNVSLFEVLEEIHLPPGVAEKKGGSTEVIVPMPADWVTLWARSKKEKPETVLVKDTILSPSGKILGEREYSVNLQENGRSRAIRRIPLPPSDKSGVYRFRTQVKDEEQKSWRRVSEIPLEVIADKPSNKR